MGCCKSKPKGRGNCTANAEESSTDRTVALKRLKRDLVECQAGMINGIFASPMPSGTTNDMLRWSAIISGPKDTPFEDMVFRLTIVFPFNYPFRPPKVCFTSPVFHPNICPETGVVCIDILGTYGDDEQAIIPGRIRGSWTPALSVSKVLISIQSLLNDPNINHAININAANLYKRDRPSYCEKVNQLARSNNNDETNVLKQVLF